MVRERVKNTPMPSNPIPDRDPMREVFDGSLLKVEDQDLLALEPQPGTGTVINGPLIVRYAVRFLDRPHLSIVPGLVVLDYGETLTGEEAWIFLTERSNLHPRADVLGYRNDGEEEMIVVKKLDLALPIEVLVYSEEDAITPVAGATALIAPESASIPKWLLEYLPRYNTIADWQSDRETL